jgi:hypothetical protein
MEFDFFLPLQSFLHYFYKKWIVFIYTAVLSGRTALILFVFLGLSTIFLYLKKIKFNPARILMSVFIIIVLGNFIFSKFSSNFDVDIVITEKHLGKIKDGGRRSEQTRQILNQFYKILLEVVL